MNSIKISVHGAYADLTGHTLITSGMVGLPCEFAFGEPWEGLTKTAVFRAGNETRDIVGIDTVVTVPHEVLEKPGTKLFIGVYGTNSEGDLVIPTIWVDAGFILSGADPSGDPSTDPALPVWGQVMKNAVQTVPQALTPTQQSQARKNINAPSFDDVKSLEPYVIPVVNIGSNFSIKEGFDLNWDRMVECANAGVPVCCYIETGGYTFPLVIIDDDIASFVMNVDAIAQTLLLQKTGEIDVGIHTLATSEELENKYVSTQKQGLSEERQKQARENIGAASNEAVKTIESNTVSTTKQTLTEEQQAQARENISALSNDTFMELVDAVDNMYSNNIAPINKKTAGMRFSGSTYLFKNPDISHPTGWATVESHYAKFAELEVNGSPVWGTPHRSVKCYSKSGSLILERDHIYMVNGDDVSLVITHAGSGEVWSVKNVKFVMAICGRVGDFYDEKNKTENLNSRDCAYAKILYPKSTLGITSVSSTAQPIYGGTENAKENKYTATISWVGAADVTEL